MKRILSLVFLFSVPLSGCNSCSSKGSEDAGMDDATDGNDLDMAVLDETESVIEIQDTVIELQDETGDALESGDGDIYESDLSDTTTDIDYIADLIGYQELVPYPVSRPPTPCGEGCRQVSFADHGVWYGNYDVWGDYLVFNIIESPGKKVILVDLTSLDHYVVNEADASEEGGPANGWVTLYDNIILYGYMLRFYHVDTNYLMRFDLSSNYQTSIWRKDYPENNGPSQYDIFGDHVIWWDNRTGDMGDGHHYLLNTASGEEREISTEPCFVCDIALYGNYAVFEGDAEGRTVIHLFVHEIESGETRKITIGDWDHVVPSVYGDIVVWTDLRNGGDYLSLEHSDIYMKDLRTDEESAICDHTASQGAAYIWGNKIAWTDYRNDPEYPNVPSRASVVDIFMYDIETGEEVQFTSNPGRKSVVKIHENKLYYIMADSSGILSVFEKIIE